MYWLAARVAHFVSMLIDSLKDNLPVRVSHSFQRWMTWLSIWTSYCPYRNTAKRSAPIKAVWTASGRWPERPVRWSHWCTKHGSSTSTVSRVPSTLYYLSFCGGLFLFFSWNVFQINLTHTVTIWVSWQCSSDLSLHRCAHVPPNQTVSLPSAKPSPGGCRWQGMALYLVNVMSADC